jgi:uncharacterized caspase-like protein
VLKFNKALLLVVWLFSSVVDAQSLNLYPTPFVIGERLVVLTTSSGDIDGVLPMVAIDKEFKVSHYSLPIGNYRPLVEVNYSLSSSQFSVIVGRTRQVSSTGEGLSPGCKLFVFEAENLAQFTEEKISDSRCDQLLSAVGSKFESQVSLSWMTPVTKEVVWQGLRFTGGQAGNRVEIRSSAVAVADLYVYTKGAALIIEEGAFDAIGPVGNDLRFNGGGRTISMNQLYEVFFRPDIVRRKLAGQSITGLLGNTKLSDALAAPPPFVQLLSKQQNVSGKFHRVYFSIEPRAGGISELRFFQNGKLIKSDGRYKDASSRETIPVGSTSKVAGLFAEDQITRNALAMQNGSPVPPLSLQTRTVDAARSAAERKCKPGQVSDPCKSEIEIEVIPGEENTITMVAFNRDNTIQSAPASVTFTSTLPKEEPRLWLLPVGINQFQGISPLVNARKDAQDFACAYAGRQALKTAGVNCSDEGKASSLFKPQNIHVPRALFDAQATKANILAALDEIAQKAKPSDTFVWFVASHGMLDGNGLFGIVAADTKFKCPNNLCTEVEGAITSNEILEASKKIKAMKQLVVLDTCHSGGLDAKLSGLYDARVSLLAKNMGLHMFASAQATEAALDGKPGTNGAFTAQLLEGIKGAAPKNAQGQISVISLGEFAKRKTVEATSAKTNDGTKRSTQTPVIYHFGQDAALANY